MTEAWRSHDGPIQVRIPDVVFVHDTKKLAEIPLIVDSTLRRR